MSDSAELRRATGRSELVWQAAWKLLPEKVQELLNKADPAEPFLWDALVPDGTDPQAMLLSVVEEACGPLPDNE